MTTAAVQQGSAMFHHQSTLSPFITRGAVQPFSATTCATAAVDTSPISG